jgi:quercetin dioxygenase-like cupin family protein
MNLKKLGVCVVAAIAFAAIAVYAENPKATSVMHISSKTGKWVDGPLETVKMIPIRGDMQKGAYATFTKFTPGADHGWHTHTNDVRIVVLDGAYLYRDESGKDLRVVAGEYFSVPGGQKHWSGGDVRAGCLFFQEAEGKFDLTPAEAPASKKTE